MARVSGDPNEEVGSTCTLSPVKSHSLRWHFHIRKGHSFLREHLFNCFAEAHYFGECHAVATCESGIPKNGCIEAALRQCGDQAFIARDGFVSPACFVRYRLQHVRIMISQINDVVSQVNARATPSLALLHELYTRQKLSLPFTDSEAVSRDTILSMFVIAVRGHNYI